MTTTTDARPTSRLLYGVIFVPYLPDPCLLPNRRRNAHWSVQNEATQALRMAVRGADIRMDDVHQLPLTERVEIAYTVFWGDRYKGKRKLPDVDALPTACKPILDGLIDAGILVDDSDEHVGKVSATQVRGDKEGVYVMIQSAPVVWDGEEAQ